MSAYTGICVAASICVVGASALPASAQWTDDPAVNSPIVTASGDQVQPKVVATADGGAYVSWFDNRSGGYDVYMQRLNALGEPQWTSDGVLIADRSFSSTQDYDLTIDGDGHAVVAFRDDRFGGIVVTASRVAPDGTQVWGSTGVQPSLTGGFIGAIRVEATSDGNIAVGWYNGSAARVVKLDADGNELWATDIGSSPTGSFTVSDLIASDAPMASGQVVVLMTTIGTFITPRHLYAQKLDSNGDVMWPAPVAIHTASSLQIGNFPGGVSDGSGGFLTTWYETGSLDVRAQHVSAAGAVQFGAGGAQVSTDGSRSRVDPQLAHDASAGVTYVFWREQAANQSAIGIYGQKFDASGSRQWSDTGFPAFESANETTQVQTLGHSAGVQAYFVERLSPTSQRILGVILDEDAGGGMLAPGDVFDVSTVEAGVSRLASVRTAQNMAVLVWQDARNGSDDLYAQNVNEDGSLGPVDDAPVGDLNDDGVVDSADLLILLSSWGVCAGCPADLDGSGVVDSADLLILLGNWG